MHILLRSGYNQIYLSLNGLSFITRSGIHYGEPITIKDVHSGDVISVGGEVNIMGKVEGKVVAFNADIRLRTNSVVTGDVIAIGGNIYKDSYITVWGNMWEMPSMHLPFLDLFVSPMSGQVFQLIIQIFAILLFLLVLFIYANFGRKHLSEMSNAVTYNWKGAVLFIVLSIIFVPILILVLIASSIGILFIPILFLVLIAFAYMGFMAITVRIGKKILKKESDSTANLYFSGLIGYFILNGFIIIGILLSLIDTDFFNIAGAVFKVIGTVLVYLLIAYGLGVSISSLKEKAKSG